MVYLGTRPNGTRRIKTKVFESPEEAEAWAADIRLQRKWGTLVEPSKDTLAAYGRRWLDDVQRERVRPKTYHTYSTLFRRFIEDAELDAPELGQVRMDQLRPEHLEAFYRWMIRVRGLSKVTVKGLHAVLRQVLKRGYKRKDLALDVHGQIDMPRERANKRTVNAMSEKELLRFLEAAKTLRRDESGNRIPCRHHALWFVIQATGVRPAEALGLKWSDLDLANRTMRVERSLTRVPGDRWTLTDAKTTNAARQIRLPNAAIPVLRQNITQHAADQLKAGDTWKDKHGLVFTTETGEPADWSNLRRSFVAIMRRAGLGKQEEGPAKRKGQPGPKKLGRFVPAYRPYDLRHTHATLSFKAGVPAKVISERLGHHKASFTMDVYTAFIPDMQDRAADAWDAILGEGVGVRLGAL
jgi:integrase